MNRSPQHQTAVVKSTLAGPHWELAATGAVVAAYLLAETIFGSYAPDVMNIFGPAWLGGVLALAAWSMARRNPDVTWTAIFWFRVATSVYFCAGSLVPLLASYTTSAYLRTYYEFQDAEILKLNLIVATSTLLVQLTSFVIDQASRRTAPDSRNKSADAQMGSSALRIGLLFLLLGGTIKYWLIVPSSLGLTNLVVPGGLAAFGNGTLIAIYLLTAWSLQSAPRAFPFICCFIAIEMFTGLLLFNKTWVLLPIVVFALAWFRAGMSTPKVVVIAVLFSVSFGLLQPWVAYARQTEMVTLGGPTTESPSKRIEILTSYFSDTSSVALSMTDDSSLARFSFVNVATFVIARYDHGLPGNNLDGALTLLVPRFLWPEKPIYDPGAELHLLMTGMEGSSISAGLFAEAYWALGWWGVVLLTIPYAIVLTLVSRYALGVLRRGQWIYLPALFTAMTLGLHVDNAYATTVVGATAILIGVHMVCYAMHVVLASRAPRAGRGLGRA